MLIIRKCLAGKLNATNGLPDLFPQALRRFVFRIAISLWLSGVVCTVAGATLPAGFTETLVVNGLSRPTAMDFAPDGRLFVCLQGGQLRVIKNGTLLATPFLSLTVDSSGERGLLGVTFDPNFTSNNFVYVYYTVPAAPIHNRLSRFTANGDVAVSNSEVVILELNNLNAGNHNGGAIHFGPDGKLYIAVGENAVPSNSQTLSNLLGKVLRINSDGSIPTDNPFYNTATGVNRSIWALGLRNPFTFAFQPGTTKMFINDVGQVSWEEINDGIPGSNYGWNACEGACSPPNVNFRDPIFQYGHGSSSTTGCAIVGGGFYNPIAVQFPASYIGKYFFADLCTGWVRVLDPASNNATDFASGISQPVDLKVAADGSLYYLSIGSAAVFRIQFAGTTPVLLTEENTDSAIALTSVNALRDPFPLIDTFNFSADNRTRVMLFGINLALLPGEDSSAVTAQAQDTQLNNYPLLVEFVGKVPNFDWLTQVIVRLPDNLPTNQDILVSVMLHGKTSNTVRFRMR